VLDPDAAVGETITGTIMTIDAEDNQFILATGMADTQVCVDEETSITLVTLDDEGSETAEVGLGDLAAELDAGAELEAEVFGAEGTDGCFEAESVRAELDETSNEAPVADAGEDRTVTVGDTVTLNGNGADNDGDSLTYSWSFAALPDDSEATLTNADMPSASFTTDVAGDYVVELVVNDGTEDSTPDQVTITAEAATQ